MQKLSNTEKNSDKKERRWEITRQSHFALSWGLYGLDACNTQSQGDGNSYACKTYHIAEYYSMAQRVPQSLLQLYTATKLILVQ